MKRVSSMVAAISLLLVAAGPVVAADFPEQGNPQSCAVLASLPKDVISHLFAVSPATAQRLLDQLADACD